MFWIWSTTKFLNPGSRATFIQRIWKINTNLNQSQLLPPFIFERWKGTSIGSWLLSILRIYRLKSKFRYAIMHESPVIWSYYGLLRRFWFIIAVCIQNCVLNFSCIVFMYGNFIWECKFSITFLCIRDKFMVLTHAWFRKKSYLGIPFLKKNI